MSIDKKLLKRLKALYVEDDSNIRHELSGLLSNFFGKVYTAEDGEAGLNMYLENKDDIDVILSDINMPKLTGIEMMKKIRETDKTIPVIFATAYSDNDFLSEAIKLKVYDYIIKPIDVRNLLTVMNTLANILYQDFLINQQNKELEKYKNIIDNNNIVMKTDVTGKVTYVNKHFCETTGYDKEELEDKEFDIIRHKDTDSAIITKMFSTTLSEGEAWQGKMKCVTKFGDPYTVDCYCIPTINDAGEITGTISVQRDITAELNHKRELQVALMKDKGEIFLKGKESMAELNGIISELNNRIVDLQKLLKQSQAEKDKILHNTEKHSIENKRLKIELKQYKKNSSFVEEKNTLTLKINKENSDLKQEISRLKTQNEHLKNDAYADQMKEKLNLEVRIEDLEEALAEANKKLEDVETPEGLRQKLDYWKQKARDESRRADNLERQVMQHGDANIINRLFNKKR